MFPNTYTQHKPQWLKRLFARSLYVCYLLCAYANLLCDQNFLLQSVAQLNF